jgi:hypothetical protein
VGTTVSRNDPNEPSLDAPKLEDGLPIRLPLGYEHSADAQSP